MALYTSGGRLRATPNTVAAMRRSAEKRRCPTCGRGSALTRFDDGVSSGSYCRWDDCDYDRIKAR